MASAWWPVASMTTLLSRAMGSTQVISRGMAFTGVQFMTTPATRPPSRTTRSLTSVTFWKVTPASQAALIKPVAAWGPSVM